jgi:hypothetical protein
MATRVSENGLIRVAETIAGIPGVSSLNDARITAIHKEEFTTDPALRGWLIGDGWAWDVGNSNMEIV